jgi:adenylate cyclase
MGMEIERKFLVTGDFKNQAEYTEAIMQAYLSSVPERTVRVRIRGKRGWITVKGGGSPSGLSRFEWEMEIPLADAVALMDLCEPGRIEKMRHRVMAGRHQVDVDEFLGENAGLVLAEIELQSEDEEFEKPDWLGEEVTGRPEYYNAMLIRRPYKTW